MRTYTFKLTIPEGDDEFWAFIRRDEKKTGCDEVREEIRKALDVAGFYESRLVLEQFKDTP